MKKRRENPKNKKRGVILLRNLPNKNHKSRHKRIRMSTGVINI